MASAYIGNDLLKKVDAKSEVQYFRDTEIAGFALKVMPNGSKTYILQCRLGRGRLAPQRTFKIGAHGTWTPQKAREEAKRFKQLAEAGIEYVADWVLDEQPVPIRTRTGSLVSIPYTVEINDVVISAVQQQPSDEILRRGRDQFDRLYQDGAKTPRVMAISIHPYLTGVPHRIRYLEALYDHILGHDGVVMWTGAEILDWYRSEIARTS